jgi:saccharopine dehydrogenase-like NADP-dependent oxidoreductase
MQITVIGAAGKNAPGAIRDFADAREVSKVVLADLESKRAVLEERSSQWGEGKSQIVFMDFDRPETIESAIRGSVVVANCSLFTFNLKVMEACLKEGVHYVDMGGFFHLSRKQLEPSMSARWKEKGLIAIVGMGSAPGITNVLARTAVDMLDTVESVHLRDGIANFAILDTPLPVPYALETLIDEFYVNCFAFENGDWKEIPSLSGAEEIDFPPPIGRQTVYNTLHTEVATVPVSFKSKGIKDMTFKLGLPTFLHEKLKFIAALGLASKQPIEIGGKPVVPRDLLFELVNRLPKPKPVKPDDHKALRADVRGTKDGQTMDICVQMMCHPYEPWAMATGPYSVGGPVGVTCRMIAAGTIHERGAFPAEACIPPKAFFRAMEERGFRADVTIRYPVV